MDSLMAAFVAAVLTQVGDRTPWLAAILATRFQRPMAVLAGTALAIAIINGLGAAGGAVLRPMLVPEAQSLLLAAALSAAGATSLFGLKPPDTLAKWRIGPFATALLGTGILGFGDRTQFITAALAAQDAPVFAAIGATLGALVVNVPAILAGEAGRRRVPVAAMRIGAGIMLLLVGVVIGLRAAQLL